MSSLKTSIKIILMNFSSPSQMQLNSVYDVLANIDKHTNNMTYCQKDGFYP